MTTKQPLSPAERAILAVLEANAALCMDVARERAYLAAQLARELERLEREGGGRDVG